MANNGAGYMDEEEEDRSPAPTGQQLHSTKHGWWNGGAMHGSPWWLWWHAIRPHDGAAPRS